MKKMDALEKAISKSLKGTYKRLGGTEKMLKNGRSLMRSYRTADARHAKTLQRAAEAQALKKAARVGTVKKAASIAGQAAVLGGAAYMNYKIVQNSVNKFKRKIDREVKAEGKRTAQLINAARKRNNDKRRYK